MEQKKCKYCGTENVENAKFCHECGGQFDDVKYEELLGIEIKESDFSNYLIQGHMRHSIKINNSLTVEIKSLSGRDLFDIQQELDNYLKENKMDKPTYETIDLIREKIQVAAGMMKMNNIELGATLPARIARVDNMGAELIAIIHQKIGTYAAAIGQSIQRGDLVGF